ncbi:MAG: hypothetical protein Unbinned3987contig1001_44 [Prokaryotic dsDNA virus sp.]|jgi:hypothetical protein|nr:MAG: hypothetical protein Unbinned3987contig1001_44 [Prokaryotic dsDNA virus sp.]|tara:strand:- start:3255 stop:6545 length:3291 start_codon:yes stop_codon:yes gene_type:complete
MKPVIKLVAYRKQTLAENSHKAYELDLMEDPNISINYKFADIKDPSKRQSSYSQTFRLPFTDINDEFFSFWDSTIVGGEEVSSFSTMTTVSAEMYLNGAVQLKGKLTLKSKHKKAKYYEVLLLSDVADLFSLMGNKTLQQSWANVTEYNHDLTSTNITNTWNNTMPSNFVDIVGSCCKIVYPISSNKFPLLYNPDDFLGNDGSNTSYQVWDDTAAGGAGAYVDVFGYSPHKLFLTGLKPAVQLRTMLEVLFQSHGYTWTSSFFDSVYFRRLYMTTCNWMEGEGTHAALTNPSTAPPMVDACRIGQRKMQIIYSPTQGSYNLDPNTLQRAGGAMNNLSIDNLDNNWYTSSVKWDTIPINDPDGVLLSNTLVNDGALATLPSGSSAVTTTDGGIFFPDGSGSSVDGGGDMQWESSEIYQLNELKIKFDSHICLITVLGGDCDECGGSGYGTNDVNIPYTDYESNLSGAFNYNRRLGVQLVIYNQDGVRVAISPIQSVNYPKGNVQHTSANLCNQDPPVSFNRTLTSGSQVHCDDVTGNLSDAPWIPINWEFSNEYAIVQEGDKLKPKIRVGIWNGSNWNTNDFSTFNWFVIDDGDQEGRNCAWFCRKNEMVGQNNSDYGYDTSLPIPIAILGAPENYGGVNNFGVVGTIDGYEVRTMLTFYREFAGTTVNPYGQQVSIHNCLDPEITQASFLKDLIGRFNLVIQSDPNSSTNLIIEPMQEFLLESNMTKKDWTKKIDNEKETIIKPTTELRFKEIHLKDLPDEDYFNRHVKQDFPEELSPYGRYDAVYSFDTYTSGQNQTNTPIFSPYIVDIIRDEFVPYYDTYLFRVLLHKNYSYTEEGQMDFPATNPKLFYYGGSPVNVVDQGGLYYMHWVDESGAPQVGQYDEYPLCSVFEVTADNTAYSNTTPLQPDGKILLWRTNFPIIAQNQLPINTNYPGTPPINLNGYYNTYWRDYLNSLYHPDSRVMIRYFHLDEIDIAQFKFNDEIFIEDSWWRIIEISNYQVGAKASVKVTLVNIVLTNRRELSTCGYSPQLNPDGSIFYVGQDTGSFIVALAIPYWIPDGGGSPTVFVDDPECCLEGNGTPIESNNGLYFCMAYEE